MNKEKIERRIKSCELIRECAEENLNELNIQLRDLREAEKPKLRHGDFGYRNAKDGNVQDGGSRVLLFKGKDGIGYCDDKYYSGGIAGSKYLIFGNIFDLLKEWSEDLEHFKFDVHTYGIDTDQRHAPIKVAGTWHTLTEAEEIWHKLGRLIATYKRTQE